MSKLLGPQNSYQKTIPFTKVVQPSIKKGKNPQTGRTIKAAAKKVVKFKAGNDLAGKVK